MTYMAPCNTTDCSGDPADLEFFKIAEEGQYTPGGSVWVQQQLYEGYPISVDIFALFVVLSYHDTKQVCPPLFSGHDTV
jgi:hypothetical protein